MRVAQTLDLIEVHQLANSRFFVLSYEQIFQGLQRESENLSARISLEKTYRLRSAHLAGLIRITAYR